MEQYTDLRILDCNRVNSTQYQSGNNDNPAIFTNELGEGVKLDVGDEVSIQGAFVSEVGAGADTIEFKGNYLLDYKNQPITKTLSYTSEQGQYPTRNWDSNYQNIIGDYQAKISSPQSVTYKLKDNTCKLQTEYWISNNGRGYMFLPRRFAYDEFYNENTSGTQIADLWNDVDSSRSGMTFHFSRNQTIIEDDYQYYRDGYVPLGGLLDQYPLGHFVPKNNNKRFTILQKHGWSYYQKVLYRYDGIVNGEAVIPPIRDPCYDTYIKYIKLIDIEVATGFNTPSDISSQITNQLKKGQDPKIFKAKDNQNGIQHITTTYETETWKPFRSASYRDFDHVNFANYNLSPTLNDRAVQYYSSYENLAVKRPDIFLAGRECNNYAGTTLYGAINIVDKETAILYTAYLYDVDNLTNLSNLFKTQNNYPELFEGRSFRDDLLPLNSLNGIDDCRFLHMNTFDNASQSGYLGSDNYTNASDYSSIPVFFAYDKNFIDIDTGGTTEDELSYGFATKYYNSTLLKDCIALHPNKLSGDGGLPIFAFQRWVDNASGFVAFDIELTRKFGFDYHFNAYSTMAMIPFSGRMDADYINNCKWGVQDLNENVAGPDRGTWSAISNILSQSYIGANDPLFNFDSVSSRFYFSNLHTSEYAGQTDILAGLSNTDAPIINPRAGVPVYKMNPRFNQYEYCPNLKPYEKSMTGKTEWNPVISSASDINAFDIMSRQVDPFTIFDANSGIFITDFGYNSTDFSRGLWSILGFTNSQVSQTESATLNRLTRIDDINKSALSIITTNCKVVSSDTLAYNVNPFGAVFYTNQITAPMVMQGRDPFYVNGSLNTNTSPAIYTIPIFPAISIETESIKITATNLPRKMLKPYYLIRSDIIEQPKFIGNNKALLPVVGVCDKQYSGGDFYFGSNNDFTFRITKPRTITSITTSIHDPDGSFSRCDNESAIIYKVIKNVTADIDLLNQVVNKK